MREISNFTSEEIFQVSFKGNAKHQIEFKPEEKSQRDLVVKELLSLYDVYQPNSHL